MNCATALPSTKATVYGIERSSNVEASSGLVSEFTFTSRHRPPYSRSSFSRSGPSTLHGPHHGAQKSTRTGTSIEASITSRSNVDKVASIIDFPQVVLVRWRGKIESSTRGGVSRVARRKAGDPHPGGA